MADTEKAMRMLEQAPLDQLVQSLGAAIAEAQFNMDRFVIQTLELLDDKYNNGIQLPDESDKRSMLELGFAPSFYHFSEATIIAKVAFSALDSTEFRVGGEIGGGYKGLFYAFVNASYSNKYSFTADGSSEVRTTIVSLPPPGPLNDLINDRIAKEKQ